MTVSTTQNRTSFAGNGSTQIFAVPFIFFDEADLVVISTVDSTGVSTTKSLTTHYTVSGGDGDDGSVTMLTAPASGTTLTILREPTRTQTLDLVENDPLPAEEVETAFDKLTTIGQRNRDLINRSVRQPDGDTANIGVLPSKVSRAGKYLGFDATTGDPIAVDGAADASPISDYGKTLVDDADAATALATLTLRSADDATKGAALVDYLNAGTGAASRTLASKLGDVLSVKDFGATGDGTTDDTTKIQAAITAAQLTGKAVFIPAGAYKISAALSITARVKIYGEGYRGDAGAVYRISTTVPTTLASTLVCGTNHDAISIVTNDAVTLEGFQISYPSTPDADTVGVKGAAASGTTSANTYSVFRDLFISGADIGVSLTDFYDFVIDNVNIANAQTKSLHLKVVNYPSYGDGTVTNCTMYSGTISSHIHVESSGGLRIVNNKLNEGNDVDSIGIYVNPWNYTVSGTATAFQMEPMLIANNSIEGQIQGIVFERQASSLGGVSMLSITGNEVFVASQAVQVVADSTNQWLNGFSIVGNTFLCNVDSSVLVALDGCQNGIVGDNLFAGSASVTTATSMTVGTHTSNVRRASNSVTSAVTNGSFASPAVPASATEVENTFPFVCEVSIYNGTGTEVLINGDTVLQQSSGAFATTKTLNPGDAIKLTYTVAPDWIWRQIDP